MSIVEDSFDFRLSISTVEFGGVVSVLLALDFALVLEADLADVAFLALAMVFSLPAYRENLVVVEF